MSDLRDGRGAANPGGTPAFLNARYIWGPRDINTNELDPRYLPTPRPWTDYLIEVQRTTRLAKFRNRFFKGVPK